MTRGTPGADMSEQQTVDVLLATYNGGRFIREQLDSIVAQTHREWRLLVRDDGSSDDTVDILLEYERRLRGKLVLIEDELGRLGASQNFGRLLELSTGPYVAFADQDDIWMPYKLSRMLESAKAVEGQYGVKHPILVHSDLKVVDEGGRLIAESFWKYQALRPNVCDWRRFIVQNVVTGCATLINAALRDLATPIPKEAIMHDWWVALVAARFGVIAHVPQSTVEYRQHAGNNTGAKGWNVGYVARQGYAVLSGGCRRRVQETQRQAAVFAARYDGMLTVADRQVIEGYVRLKERGPLGRRMFLLRNGLLKVGILRNMGWLLTI